MPRATWPSWRPERGRREQAAKRQEAEHKTEIAARRITARTVLLADVDPDTRDLPPTLRGAVERLDAIGGGVRITQGRLDVRVPPGEVGASQYGARLGGRLARPPLPG